MDNNLQETMDVFEALVDEGPMRLQLPRGVWLHVLLMVQLALIHPAIHEPTRRKGRAFIAAVQRRMRASVQRWIDRAGQPVDSARVKFQYTTPSELPWGSTQN